MGLPVVASRVGGVPEIVREGEAGYLTDPEDIDSMVAALAKPIDDPDLRKGLGSHAREYVEASHSIDRLPGLLEGLYRTVLS